MKETKAYFKSYDLGDWEGGIAVFVTYGEHGVIVVSIPRLRLSTVLTGHNDSQALTTMLMHNPTMYNNPDEMNLFVGMIMRDIHQMRVKV